MSTSANTSENINIDTNTNANGCCTVHGGVRSEWKLVAAIFQSTYSQVSADPIWTAAGRRTTIWTAARLLYGALLQLLEDIVPPRPSCKRSCKLFSLFFSTGFSNPFPLLFKGSLAGHHANCKHAVSIEFLFCPAPPLKTHWSCVTSNTNMKTQTHKHKDIMQTEITLFLAMHPPSRRSD